MTKQHLLSLIIIGSIICMGILQFVPLQLAGTAQASALLEDTLMRFFGGLVFLVVLVSYGYQRLFTFPRVSKAMLLVVLPGLIVVVNNFPIIATLSGRTEITESFGYIILFIISCISIGFFEEVIFRGALLTVFLQRFKENQKGIFMAIVTSSAIFGLIHLINLISGASVSGTILQVGYSFLMGMLFAVVFLKTKNIWYSIILHTIYNISGLFFRSVGSVTNQFDLATIIITTILAILVIVYYLHIFSTLTSQDLQILYTPKEETNE